MISPPEKICYCSLNVNINILANMLVVENIKYVKKSS